MKEFWYMLSMCFLSFAVYGCMNVDQPRNIDYDSPQHFSCPLPDMIEYCEGSSPGNMKCKCILNQNIRLG